MIAFLDEYVKGVIVFFELFFLFLYKYADFAFSGINSFFQAKKDAATGKVKASAAEFPQDWRSSFGMKVAEHDMSTQVNFLDGYISPSDTEQTEGSNE